MQKWEYHTHVKQISEEELRRLGEQGWELVTALKMDTNAYYYFKRPRVDEKQPAGFHNQ